MIWQRAILWVVIFEIGIGSSRAAETGFSDLLTKVPASANTLVMLNAEQIFASDVATREGWKERYQATYADTPLLLPPGAQQFVLAAELDLAYMKPRWEVAVMRLRTDPSLELIARKIGGELDSVGGREAISTPKDALITNFGPRLFGIIRPGNRQSAARWIRDAESRRDVELSPYLAATASVPDRVGTEIMLAIDLTDALSPARVREAVEKSPVIRDASLDLDEVADVLASVRGAALGVRVTQRTYGKLKVDFDRDIAVLADVGKPLLLEVLAEAGAEIDEFNDWNVEVTERQIALDGELTRSGLRRLFSFLELDATAVDAATDGGPMEPSGSAAEAATAEKSQQYFQSVTRYLNDLKRERGATTYTSIALWFDKYARRIDRLPILGVDKELVGYGGYVVGQLRDCVEAIRGSGIRSGARSAQVTGGAVGSGYYGGYDYGGYRVFSSSANYAAAQVGAVEQERRAIRAQERGQSSTDVRAIIREIQEETSRIRRSMTERYNVEFVESSGQ
jgi:hypothetical protein